MLYQSTPRFAPDPSLSDLRDYGQAIGEGVSAENLEPVPLTSIFELALELHKLPDEVMDSDGELGDQFRSWLSGRRRGENIRASRR